MPSFAKAGVSSVNVFVAGELPAAHLRPRLLDGRALIWGKLVGALLGKVCKDEQGLRCALLFLFGKLTDFGYRKKLITDTN